MSHLGALKANTSPSTQFPLSTRAVPIRSAPHRHRASRIHSHTGLAAGPLAPFAFRPWFRRQGALDSTAISFSPPPLFGKRLQGRPLSCIPRGESLPRLPPFSSSPSCSLLGAAALPLTWRLPRQRPVSPLPSSAKLLRPRGWFSGSLLSGGWLPFSSARLGPSRRVSSHSRL